MDDIVSRKEFGPEGASLQGVVAQWGDAVSFPQSAGAAPPAA